MGERTTASSTSFTATAGASTRTRTSSSTLVLVLARVPVPVQVPAPPPPACTGTGQCYRHHHFHCDEHGSYLCDDDYSNCNCKPRLPWPKRRDLSSECSDPRLQRAPAAPAGDLDLLWNEPANRKHTMSRASGLSCWVAVATTITRSKAIPPRTAEPARLHL